MLDSDPTEPSTPAAAPAETQDTPAPRKRTPRKAAAKKTASSGDPSGEDTVATPSAPDADGAADPPQTAVPAARTPRKRTPRKAAAVPDDVAAPDASPADDAGPADVPAAKAPAKRSARTAAFSGSATDGAPQTDAEGAAAKPARRRAVKKAASAVSAPELLAAPSSDEQAAAVAAPAMAAPGVLFIAPAEDAGAVPTRRRPAKKQTAAGGDAADDATGAAGAPTAELTEPADDTPAPRKRASRAKKVAPPAEPASPDAAQTAGDEVPDAGAEDEITADPDDLRDAAIEQASGARRRRRRGRRGRGSGGARSEQDGSEPDDDSGDDGAEDTDDTASADSGDDTADSGGSAEDGDEQGSTASRRRRRRRRSGNGDDSGNDDPPNTVTHVREPKSKKDDGDDGVRGVKGSTRLEAKRQRRRDGRETTRRRSPILSESEFLARRESVERVMAVRQNGDRTQIAVLEDDILVEHYVTRASATSYVGNVYLGRVQNVLPSMEAAFIDIGKGRNGVLYAGEVNWDAAGLGGKSRAIENALKSGDPVLVQVSKDPVGHKGARLTSQVSLPGRFLVLVPGGGMTGISRRLPDTERHRLKAILKKIVPEDAGVIVRTAAEGASEEDLTRDVERLVAQWESIQEKSKNTKSAPALVHGEPDLATRVVRDVFNEDFAKLFVDGLEAWDTISDYLGGVAPDLAERLSRHTADTDLFHDLRVDEQLMKALDRKVYLPSGGSLVIDRTEAMTVVDVNTGKFIGSGGNLEQTVTRNNLEAAEEIVRQLRLRDVGGIVVIDFIDMVLESNRELVLRRLTECLGRDRTKHQVAEVTSLGLVQMTRKRVGEGLLEAFSDTCEHCHGRGLIVHAEPVDKSSGSSASDDDDHQSGGGRNRRKRGGRSSDTAAAPVEELSAAASDEQRKAAAAAIAAVHRAAEGDKPASDAPELDELAGGLFAAALQTNDESPTDSAPEPVVARRTRRVATRPAGGPPATEPAVVVVPVPEHASGAAPEPDPEPTPGTSGAHESPVPEAASAVRPRRRRAASRPAGPPTS